MTRLRAVALDFESTGSVPGLSNEPWQIGIAPIVDGEIGGGFFESLLRVGPRPFNPHAPGRHALLRAEIAAAPTLHDLWPQVMAQLAGTFIVAHNAGTERSLLAAVAPLHVFGPWIDTLTLARAAWPGLPSYELERLTECFGLVPGIVGLCPGRAPHDALYDAVACAALLLHILRQPGWETVTAEELAEMS
ncbi:MAG: exonuclease domain-containing protein [Kiritimatiellia bacterium]|jgi:DNA polymerase III epsilon subunit-like protein